jgi:hypothetical protein
MKYRLHTQLASTFLFIISTIGFGQTFNLDVTSSFNISPSNGVMSNTGILQNIGNTNGQIQDSNLVIGQAIADSLTFHNQLNTTIPTYFPTPLMENGQVVNGGEYSISAITTTNSVITLNANNNPNAEFTIIIHVSVSSNTNPQAESINSIEVNNDFRKGDELINMASGNAMAPNYSTTNASLFDEERNPNSIYPSSFNNQINDTLNSPSTGQNEFVTRTFMDIKVNENINTIKKPNDIPYGVYFKENFRYYSAAINTKLCIVF